MLPPTASLGISYQKLSLAPKGASPHLKPFFFLGPKLRPIFKRKGLEESQQVIKIVFFFSRLGVQEKASRYLCYVLFGGTQSPGPSLMAMCSNARGGEGEGASRPPCTTHASGQSTMYKASRLIYSFLTYFQIHTADRLRIVASHLSHTSVLRFYVHYRSYSTYVQCAFQAALKAASHHSDTLVCFCVHCHSISNIGELPDISIHIAMFATLHLPTSAYPLCVHQEYRV